MDGTVVKADLECVCGDPGCIGGQSLKTLLRVGVSDGSQVRVGRVRPKPTCLRTRQPPIPHIFYISSRFFGNFVQKLALKLFSEWNGSGLNRPARTTAVSPNSPLDPLTGKSLTRSHAQWLTVGIGVNRASSQDGKKVFLSFQHFCHPMFSMAAINMFQKRSPFALVSSDFLIKIREKTHDKLHQGLSYQKKTTNLGWQRKSFNH